MKKYAKRGWRYMVLTVEEVVEKLKGYHRLAARRKVLESYSVGGGITVSRLNQDDHLQELHRKLRGMSSYQYLTKHEEKLKNTAFAYLDKYPAGILSQRDIIPTEGDTLEDTELLIELKNKIKKVVAARGYDIRSDIDAVLARVSELQDLQDEIKKIDDVLEALQEYKPEYSELLRKRYIENKQVKEIAMDMCITERTFRRWNPLALQEYARLSV